MRKFNLLLLLSLMTTAMHAQFINNGAIITIQPGATLRIETSFENQSGTIDNQGTLEVQGNFTNAPGAGTTLSGTGKLKFFGTGTSSLDAGDDVLNKVEILKTTSAGTVTLAKTTTINDSLIFSGSSDGSKILLGAFDLTLGAAATATGASQTTGYVVTNSTGRLMKVVGANNTNPLDLEIGNTSSYSPVRATMTGNAAGNVSARVITSGMSPKYNDADAFIAREWIVSTPTVTSSVLRGTYVNGDVTGTAANIKGCTYLGSGEWSFTGFDGASNTVTASTTTNTDMKLTGQNFFGKYSSNVMLGGPKSGTTMNNLLTLPLTSPYTPGETVLSIPANAVDWVLLEIRDPNNQSTVISQKSGFLLTNGSIVGLDGVPQLRNKINNNSSGTGFVVVKHRNHLGIMSSSSKNLVNNPGLNFRSGAESTFGLNSQDFDGVNSIYSMWSGDVNGDGSINAADRAETWNNRNLTGYRLSDCSMNGTVDAADRAAAWNNRNKLTSF